MALVLPGHRAQRHFPSCRRRATAARSAGASGRPRRAPSRPRWATTALPGAHLILPTAKGAIAAVLFGLAEDGADRVDPMAFGRLATVLPPGRYRIAESAKAPEHAELAFLLSAYRFARYHKAKADEIVLEAPRGPKRERVETIASAVELGRDLINTPANDMGPDGAGRRPPLALAAQVKARARSSRRATSAQECFPLVHAVGKGAAEGPRLCRHFAGARARADRRSRWSARASASTPAGSTSSRRRHASDEEGHGRRGDALAAAAMIMRAQLPVRLRVIVPIVENSVSAQSFRPGDVYPSRTGLTVEIGNTDAEGPADPRRCAGAGRRRRAGHASRFCDADRRGARGAGSGSAGVLHR